MNPDLPCVRELQALDSRIQELSDEIQRLPKHIAAIESQLESHKKALQADQDALVENQKRRRLLEGEVSAAQQKLGHIKAQMNEAKTNEQFRAFQHEIDYEEQEIRRVEDRILDKMVEAESLEYSVQGAEKALEAEQLKVAAEVEETRVRVARDQEEAAAKTAQRNQLAAAVSPGVLRTYERARKSRQGDAVARADAERCLTCNVVLRPQFSQTMRSNKEILTCESCGRILYYEPPGTTDPEQAQAESALSEPLA